jgi:hypothetical protein
VHIPKFRNGSGKILANASTPDFSATSDIILGYALNYFWVALQRKPQKTTENRIEKRMRRILRELPDINA